MFNQKITIDLGFANLVAEKSTDHTFPGEIYIGLEDSDGCWIQDIASVRHRYHYDKNDEPIFEDGLSVIVWGDKYDEDYTCEFKVDLHKL